MAIVKSTFNLPNSSGGYDTHHLETELAQIADIVRQPSTAYTSGKIVYCASVNFPIGWYLECTTGGTTASGALTFTSAPSVGSTKTDGTVTWTVRKPANTANIPSLSGYATISYVDSKVSGYATTSYVQSYVQNNSAKPNSWLPNLTRGIAIAAGTTYTASENGWLFLIQYQASTGHNEKINGYTAAYSQGNTGNHFSSSWIPVAKGSSITLVATSNTTTSRIFYPCIG